MAVIVITGASGALGAATASILARDGARVLLLARPSSRLDDLKQTLESDGCDVQALPVDLSLLTSVRDAADQLASATPRIDCLIHTAAVYNRNRTETEEGLETMLATNHLGPFLLTNLLRDRLVPGSRVIPVTAPSTTKVNMDQLTSPRRFSALGVFGATKAANLLFTFELARRGAKRGVRANAFHPGLLRSRLMRQAPLPARLLMRIGANPPDMAAGALAKLATASGSEAPTELFFKGDKPISPPTHTLDVPAQQALWERSAILVNLGDKGF